MKKITVIVPCYNEQETITNFYDEITSLWNTLSSYELEVIFIDDGSKDKTIDIVKELNAKDDRIRYSSFSRNFGKEAAIFCGLKQATGDAVIVMDADLQHPVETIPEMISKWNDGYDVIEGMKKSRGTETKVHGLFAGLFYNLMSRMIGFDMNNSSDYKLMDRKVVEALNGLEEKMTFFRAMTFWVGFSSTTVEYEVHDRVAGESKWSGKSLIKYAILNLTSFTYAPLHLILGVGFAVMIVGLLLGIDAIISFCMSESMSGYPSLVLLVVLSTGAIMMSLGIIAVYISRMYEEIKNRPRYIIKDEK